MLSLRESESSKNEKREKIAAAFRLDVSEIESSVRRVVSVMCLNEYFKHIYGKSVIDARKSELTSLISDPTRYQMWRQESRKVSFEHIVMSIDFLLKQLR